MQDAVPVHFPNGSIASAFYISDASALSASLTTLGFCEPRPVIVVIGGASELRQEYIVRLRSLFVQVLAPIAETWNAVVLDGGTDTGVMRMMGSARSKTHSTFPLIGILPQGVATFPNAPPPSEQAAPLEPHHTHFMLVPGSTWGDESQWIAEIASAIAQGAATVTVLINGGEVTWKDASESVQAGRPIVVVAGTGRAADALVSALNGKVTDDRARKILASGLLQAVSIESDHGLENAVQRILAGESVQQATLR